MGKYITSDQDILNGKFVIKGTRIPVARIVHLLKEGYTIETIHDDYPHLSIKEIEGVVDEVVEILDNKDYASKIFQT